MSFRDSCKPGKLLEVELGVRRACRGGGVEGKLFSPVFAFLHFSFTVLTMEPQSASAQEKGLVPSQANKPDQRSRGQGMQSPREPKPKGEPKLYIWEIIPKQIEHFKVLRNK